MNKDKSSIKKTKTLNLHLTNRCNMYCRHCLYSCGEKIIEEMNLKEVKKIIKEFAEISKNKGIVNMFGGEVFLRKDIFDIIDYCIFLKLNVGITTNANFSSEVTEKIIKRKISRLTVDIDGASYSIHDWLRNKKGHFLQSLKIIKTFARSGKFISSNIILHRGNVRKIEEILDLCQKIGINSISCYLFTPLGRGNNIKDLILGPVEWKETKRRVKKWIANNSPNFSVIWERSYSYNNTIASSSLPFCYRELSDIVNVRCDGKVYPCCLLFSMDFGCIGDLKKESLRRIINKKKKCFEKVDVGCPAFVYNNFNKLVDPNATTNNILPACLYNWEVLYNPVKNLKDKFVYINL